ECVRNGSGGVRGRRGGVRLAAGFSPGPDAQRGGQLWRVDDAATGALMALFYYKLWREGQSPLAALRAAQLTLYRHPECIGALARERGPDLDKIIRLPVLPGLDAADEPAGHAPVKVWAGFLLSGAGQ